MIQLGPGARLAIATHNPGKLREISALLEPYGLHTVAAAALGVPEPAETGSSFAENARLKALAVARSSALPALADDSGLEVAALGGAPGIHSARWAGPERDFDAAMRKVEQELRLSQAIQPWRAQFVCVLALADPEGNCRHWTGTVAGHLTWPPRGRSGFGYDPIFVPEGHRETFGEMWPLEKHAISHRQAAFAQLAETLPTPTGAD